ncbi:MAG: phosphoribosyltransferase [Thermoplasmatales archaeon]|nr:phosphoribosyltransferase [Candidatus Thermoplasmatota archaeon]MCL6002631.1 phosphoribosyltransferase [Candidatus Thermoplasmatota archaeon]MDA8055910.1 phosphoribosyltransferase [Thermoplasmatales archaeon]
MDFQKVPSRVVSWEEIERWAEIIVEKIGDFKFDCVISVIRGGLVPSRIVADYLSIKDIFTLKTEHWGITATPDGKAVVTYPIVKDLNGRSVLVVDDITDTGQSLKLAIEATKQKNPKVVRSATFLHIKKSEIAPDYYAEEITADNWKWFIFPWNRKEDLRNLILNCIDGPSTKDRISNCLAVKNDLFISRREFDETISWLETHDKVSVSEDKVSKI